VEQENLASNFNTEKVMKHLLFRFHIRYYKYRLYGFKIFKQSENLHISHRLERTGMEGFAGCGCGLRNKYRNRGRTALWAE
jgi:hypothetical protein